MVFSSVTFLFYFLPAFMLVYLALPRFRNSVLLLFSLVFYAWGEPLYVFLMLGCIAANYAAALWIESARTDCAKKAVLVFGVLANILILFFFKYVSFAVETLARVSHVKLSLPEALLSLTLPIGLSFYTFQGVSYVIDVYRGSAPPQRNIFTLATYISMFPQLVAGPIVRYATVADELKRRSLSLPEFSRGIRLFVFGLSAKVLLANTLAVPADSIFSTDPVALTPGAAWLGAICYGLQIFFDFSGYSTMAIGLGLMTGFHFCENFNRPYISQSITEFWQRWHISLSTWFRDYLYIPLGGNRINRARTCLNLMLVFILCGAWHGAQWTFILWGIYHGLFLMIERLGGQAIRLMPRPLRHAYALLVVLFGWVIFRCDSMRQAMAFLAALFRVDGGGSQHAGGYLTPVVVYAMVSGIIVVAMDWRWLGLHLGKAPGGAGALLLPMARMLLVFALFAFCVMSLAAGTHNPFIYYRF